LHSAEESPENDESEPEMSKRSPWGRRRRSSRRLWRRSRIRRFFKRPWNKIKTGFRKFVNKKVKPIGKKIKTFVNNKIKPIGKKITTFVNNKIKPIGKKLKPCGKAFCGLLKKSKSKGKLYISASYFPNQTGIGLHCEKH
jgi:hypothetical protein